MDNPGNEESASATEWAPLLVSLTLLVACIIFSIYALWIFWKSWNQPAAGAAQPVTKAVTPVEIDVDEFMEQMQSSTLLGDSSMLSSTRFATTWSGTNHKTEGTSKALASEEGETDRLLAWSGISCAYPSKKVGLEEKQTLCNAYGELFAGDLMAIMGPSGGGKSTLMDILAGRKETGKITGSLEVLGGETMTNRFNDAGKMLQDVTAYVPQELIFFPMQTPEEAVMFVAGLKYGKANVLEARRLLFEVGLRDPELYTRPIGGSLAGGFQVRGLSGGEKKRLALACALALKPRLIMLDEITSGLDSESALATTQLLKELCLSHGVAAIVIIHQPDGYVFECFNRLLLVSSGRCIYSDDVSNLGSLYRSCFGCEIPGSKHEIPLDLLRRLKALPDDVSFPAPGINNFLGKSQILTSQQQAEPKVSFFQKLVIVFHRNLMNHYLRNVTNLCARLVCYTACSLLDGAIFWKVGSNGNLSSVLGSFTFISLISYILPFVSLPIFVHEKKFFLFERSLGLYSPWIYCISQMLLEAWVLILAASIEASIIIPMCGFWNSDMQSWESFLMLLSPLIASGLVGSSMVVFFSILMPSQDLAFAGGAGLVTIWLGMSGGFVPFPMMEDFVSWLQWISPCKYSLQALVIGYTPAKDMAFVQQLQFDRPETVSANLGALFVFFAVLSVSTMLVLGAKREVR